MSAASVAGAAAAACVLRRMQRQVAQSGQLAIASETGGSAPMWGINNESSSFLRGSPAS